MVRPAARMKRIPHELYRDIFQFVACKKDLCALALLCRSLRPEAERLIYESLVLASSEDCVDRCKILLVSNATRARYVHSLIVTSAVNFNHKGAMISLSLILSAVVNLITLRIQGGRHSESSWVLGGCSFRLRELHCMFPVTERVAQFLQQQPHLVELSLYRVNPAIELPSNILLSLRVFEGPILPGVQLLRTHPLTHIRLNEFDLSSPSCVAMTTFNEAQLSQRSPIRTLRSFSCGCAVRLREISYCVHLFPMLEAFGACAFTVDETTQAIKALSSFAKLKKVLIKDLYGSWYQDFVQAEFVQLAETGLPTLNYVGFWNLASDTWSVKWSRNENGWSRVTNTSLMDFWREV